MWARRPEIATPCCLSVPTTKCLAPHLSAGRWAQPVINSSSHTGTTEHRVEPSPLRYCAVLTWRPAVDCTLVIALIALFIFVPWLRDHRSAIFAAYLAGLTVFVTIKVIRRRYSLEREAAIKMMALSTGSAAALFLISVVVIAAFSVWPR